MFAMNDELRQLVLEAAREGRIGFYTGPDTEPHPHPEGGFTVETHGVCEGCIWDVRLAHENKVPLKEMCGGELTRVATVEEVVAFLDAPPRRRP
jgi:hypothetical protein